MLAGGEWEPWAPHFSSFAWVGTTEWSKARLQHPLCTYLPPPPPATCLTLGLQTWPTTSWGPLRVCWPLPSFQARPLHPKIMSPASLLPTCSLDLSCEQLIPSSEGSGSQLGWILPPRGHRAICLRHFWSPHCGGGGGGGEARTVASGG